jgi:hypothetical protein
VVALINADQLQTAFAEWMKACHDVTEGAVVAIDGKTLRGFYCRGKGKGAIHMVSGLAPGKMHEKPSYDGVFHAFFLVR